MGNLGLILLHIGITSISLHLLVSVYYISGEYAFITIKINAP